MKVKRVRPVLIESENITGLWKDSKNNIHISKTLTKSNAYDNYGYWIPQQLILISLESEHIEKGDIVFYDHSLHEVKGLSPHDTMDIETIEEIWIDSDKSKKLICTQDLISLEYIVKFCEQYNNGKVDDVEIEVLIMNEGYTDVNDYPYQEIDIPKLTNGFITIVENKEPILYTEEEVYELFNSFRKDFSLYRGIQIMDVQLKDWFEQYKKHNCYVGLTLSPLKLGITSVNTKTSSHVNKN